VSRWSSKRITIRVGQGALQAFEPGVATRPAPAMAFDPAAARGAATSLESVLQGVLTGSPGAVRETLFEIDSDACRFEVVGWIDGVTSREHRAALARGRFESVYGPAARNWRIEVSEGGYRCGALAVAVPDAMLSAILGACRRAGVRPGPIRPAAGRCIDRLLRKARGGAAWIVVPDRFDAFVGLVNRGSWLAALCVPLRQERLLAGLPDILARESTLMPDEISGARVLVCSARPDTGGNPASRTQAAVPNVIECGGVRLPLEWIGT